MSEAYLGNQINSVKSIVSPFEHFSLSRAAYNCLREGFELPSVRTLTQLTSKIKSIDYI